MTCVHGDSAYFCKACAKEGEADQLYSDEIENSSKEASGIADLESLRAALDPDDWMGEQRMVDVLDKVLAELKGSQQ